MKTFLLSVVILSAFFAADALFASMPVEVTYTGCVQDGVLISEKVDFGTHATEGRNRHIRPLAGDRKPLDLSAYEGSRISVVGHLLPGDTFFAGPDTIRNLGPCTLAGPNARATADLLWEEGKTLFNTKKYPEALMKFRESVTRSPLPVRKDYVTQLETWLAQNRERATTLRAQGAAIQQQANLPGAVEKYRESLIYWPDEYLRNHITYLEDMQKGKIRDDRPADNIPCGPADPSAVEAPADFQITLGGGPVHASWGGDKAVQVNAKGEVVRIEDVRAQQAWPPYERKRTPDGIISPEAVRRLYAQVQACRFFDLKKEYWNNDIRDGGRDYLTVIANGKNHTVMVYYFRVARYEAIVSAMNREVAGAKRP